MSISRSLGILIVALVTASLVLQIAVRTEFSAYVAILVVLAVIGIVTLVKFALETAQDRKAYGWIISGKELEATCRTGDDIQSARISIVGKPVHLHLVSDKKEIDIEFSLVQELDEYLQESTSFRLGDFSKMDRD